MAKLIAVCGKICSGKTTYAAKLKNERRAALLSVDEVMLTMFGQHTGEMHDTYAARTKEYLLRKAAELVASGMDVILDWGFWTAAGRAEIRAFCADSGIECELHCIDIPDAVWQARIRSRNEAVLAGECEAYYIDKNLAEKFHSRFEMPAREEIDVWVS
ncbi:MAG: ATP-binding protein [Ruminococcaceae bacterium]|nr:ATP-binding protein [Oscillospiraceae bacterium]